MNKCYIQQVGKINTKNKDGELNGGLLTLCNEHTDNIPIEQVYITSCLLGDIKGPHVHDEPKIDRFYCIDGMCAIVCRNELDEQYQEFVLRSYDSQLLVIPPRNAHAIVNIGDKDCKILSMPSEGYDPNKPYNQREIEYKNYNWKKWHE